MVFTTAAASSENTENNGTNCRSGSVSSSVLCWRRNGQLAGPSPLLQSQQVTDEHAIQKATHEWIKRFKRLHRSADNSPQAFQQLIVSLASDVSKLHTLSVAYTGIGDIGAKIIANVLNTGNNATNGGMQLMQVDMSFTQMTCIGAAQLAAALPASRIMRIHLAGNNIQYEGARAIAEILPRTSLIALHITANNLQSDGAEVLAAAIQQQNLALEALYLSSNNIGDRGASAIAAAMRSTTCRLRGVYIAQNNIGPAGAAAIADALPHAASVESLELSINSIGPAGAQSVASAMTSPTIRLCELFIDGNNIGDVGASAIAGVLFLNPHGSLRTIDLGFNCIRQVGGTSLAQALAVNNSLETIMLSGNNFGGLAQQQMVQSIQHNANNKLKTVTGLAACMSIPMDARFVACAGVNCNRPCCGKKRRSCDISRSPNTSTSHAVDTLHCTSAASALPPPPQQQTSSPFGADRMRKRSR